MLETLQPFSALAKSLKLGLYEHYKGHRYQLINVARHSETLEEYVVYQAVSGDKELWVRPLELFCEIVDIEGKGQIPRFRYME